MSCIESFPWLFSRAICSRKAPSIMESSPTGGQVGPLMQQRTAKCPIGHFRFCLETAFKALFRGPFCHLTRFPRTTLDVRPEHSRGHRDTYAAPGDCRQAESSGSTAVGEPDGRRPGHLPSPGLKPLAFVRRTTTKRIANPPAFTPQRRCDARARSPSSRGLARTPATGECARGPRRGCPRAAERRRPRSRRPA